MLSAKAQDIADKLLAEEQTHERMPPDLYAALTELSNDEKNEIRQLLRRKHAEHCESPVKAERQQHMGSEFQTALLSDMLQVMDDGFTATADIIKRLCSLPGSQWNARKINGHQLAQWLRPLSIRPGKRIPRDGRRLRGYDRANIISCVGHVIPRTVVDESDLAPIRPSIHAETVSELPWWVDLLKTPNGIEVGILAQKAGWKNNKVAHVSVYELTKKTGVKIKRFKVEGKVYYKWPSVESQNNDEAAEPDKRQHTVSIGNAGIAAVHWSEQLWNGANEPKADDAAEPNADKLAPLEVIAAILARFEACTIARCAECGGDVLAMAATYQRDIAGQTHPLHPHCVEPWENRQTEPER